MPQSQILEYVKQTKEVGFGDDFFEVDDKVAYIAVRSDGDARGISRVEMLPGPFLIGTSD